MYSKTSNNGPSEKRSTSLQGTAHLPPIDFTIELIHYEPPRSGHLSTPNNGHWSGPDVPWPIQNYLRKRTVKLDPHNVDACRPLSYRHRRWIQWPSTVLAFLVSVKQRRGPKTRAKPITHYHAYQKYTECLYITDTSVFRTRSAAVVLGHCSRKWCYKQHLSVYLYVIIASFYIFYASSVALTIFLLKKPSNWSRIWTRIYYNNTFKRLQVLFLCLSNF